MRDCPLPLQPTHNMMILCALGKAVVEEEYPFSPEIEDRFRVDFAEDLCAILEQGVPDTDEFLPAGRRSHLLAFTQRLADWSEEEGSDPHSDSY